MSSEIPRPFLHEWEQPEIFQKWLKSITNWGAIQNMGDGADRPCILVWKQVCVQEAWPYWNLVKACRHPLLPKVNSQVAHKSPYIFCCGFTSPSPVYSALVRTLHLSRFWCFFVLLNLRSVCEGIKHAVSISVSMHAVSHTCVHTWFICVTG